MEPRCCRRGKSNPLWSASIRLASVRWWPIAEILFCMRSRAGGWQRVEGWRSRPLIRTWSLRRRSSATLRANAGAVRGDRGQRSGAESVRSFHEFSQAIKILPPPLARLCAGMERVMGIEPTLAAWEAAVLPLNYTRAPRVGLYERRRPGGNPRSSGRGGAGEDPCGCPNAAQAGAARRASAARRTAASRSARTASKRLLAAATISGRARSGRPESNGGAGAYSIASCTLSA